MFIATIKHYWHLGTKKTLCYIDEFLVPRSTVKPSQHRSVTRYINRMLPTGHRCRGDVGQV